MQKSVAAVAGSENNRPGLRARVARMSRTARIAVALGATAGSALAATALPASAAASTHAFNLARTQAVAGTDCTVTVGTDQNYPYAYPGTATLVQCARRHKTVSVTTQLQHAPVAGGTWVSWQTPTYTYPNSYGTQSLFYDWNGSCIGQWQWRVLAYVWVDGTYRGVYANSAVKTWTACTIG